MGYYFQDQLESRSWAGLGLNTNLPTTATFFLLAERNLRAQHVMARKLNNNKSGVAADKIPVSPQLYLTLPFAAQKLDESWVAWALI